MTRPALLGRAGLSTSFVYLLLFASLGVHLPFWPLWLREWGLTQGEIGTYTAMGMMIRVLAGLAIPAIADRLGARRIVLAVVALSGAVLFLGHYWIADRTLLMLATIASGGVYAGLIPLSDALGTSASKTYGFDYAQARSLGSAGFLAANLSVGWLIGEYGTSIALWWVVICLAGLGVLALTYPETKPSTHEDPPKMGDIGRLVMHPLFALFAGAISFTNASHAIYYVYGSLQWRALGLSETTIGQLWAFGVVVEVAFMLLLGRRIVEWLGPIVTIALAGAAGVLRWSAMMLDPTGPLLWLLQALHAFSFAAGHLGMVAFIATAVPSRFGATAQGLCGAVMAGLLTALAMQLGALVYPWGGGLTYSIAAGMSLIGMGLALILFKDWHPGAVINADAPKTPR